MTSIQFRAPWSRALRVASTISVTLLLMIAVSGVLVLGRAPLWVAGVLIALPVLLVLLALPFMVRGYVLDEDAITVRRMGWRTMLPLQGLLSITADAAAMRGSLRLLANGGLFSFTGIFWNRKLGRYRALVNDPQRAVVLRYRKGIVVIAPHDPQQFLMRARTLAGTAGFPSNR